METIDPAPRGAKFPSSQSLKCEGSGAVECALEPLLVIASAAKQSSLSPRRDLDCFATLAMTESVVGGVLSDAHRAVQAYSSLPRVIAMDASVLVRVHSMLRRR